ncbi:hypothetical protein ES703_50640 [subsurface metagenome]
MDIQVARFREVLGLLKPVILRKTTLPVLTNVLLKGGQAVATDLETMVIVQVPEADIDCLLPYADVVKVLQYVQGLEYLHFETKKGKVAMSWSDGSATFDTGDVKDYPEVPEFVPVAEAPIDVDILIPAMHEVLGFAAIEDTRPVLHGVTLIMGEPIAVAAGDGHRMAYKTLSQTFPQESIMVVPSSSVTTLKLLWEKTPRTPQVSDSLISAIMANKQASVALDNEKGLRFVFGDSTTAIVKLVQGDPPVWLKLIPKEDPVLEASLMAPLLELAVRRVLSVAMEGSDIVRLVFNDDTAIISAKHDGHEVESKVKVLSSQGAPNRVGLDARYLLDYLKGKDSIVTLSWVNLGSPVAFKHPNSPTVLIMPMNVDWGDAVPEPVAEQAEAEAGDSSPPTAEVPEDDSSPAPPEEAAKSPARRGKKKPHQQG